MTGLKVESVSDQVTRCTAPCIIHNYFLLEKFTAIGTFRPRSPCPLYTVYYLCYLRADLRYVTSRYIKLYINISLSDPVGRL